MSSKWSSFGTAQARSGRQGFRAMCRIVLTLLHEEAFLNRTVRINLGRCSARRVGLFLGGSWRGLAAASWGDQCDVGGGWEIDDRVGVVK
jgi:hypothetical protein